MPRHLDACGLQRMLGLAPLNQHCEQHSRFVSARQDAVVPACGDLVCAIMFDACMRQTELSGQILEVAVKRKLFGVGSITPLQFCRQTRRAWSQRCNGVAVPGIPQQQLQAILRKTRAGCHGAESHATWYSGVRIVRRVATVASKTSAPLIFWQGKSLAALPADLHFPVRTPLHCKTGNWKIPRVVIQTGRGKTARHHNNDSGAGRATAVARELAGKDVRFRWFDDSSSHAFVARHCPQALKAYECLKPAPFKADIFRCAIRARAVIWRRRLPVCVVAWAADVNGH